VTLPIAGVKEIILPHNLANNRILTLLAVGKIISINSIKFVIFAVWKHNINSLKPLPILRLNTDFKVFAVASNIGAAGYVHGYDLIMHKHWASNEEIHKANVCNSGILLPFLIMHAVF
jgi:hypothetical protein